VVNYDVVVSKVLLPALLAPLIAGLVAYLSTRLAYRITTRKGAVANPKRGGFRYGQIFSSSLVALAHGTNDAQKTMGVITLVLVAAGTQPAGSGPEFWVIVACGLAIAIGTYSGGWRIIRTMGRGLTEVKPAQGFSAECSTASAILASSHLGFALSTTQVASGSVIGSGLGRKGAKVRWNTARRIAVGWLLTLPAAAIVGAIAAAVAHLGTVGVIIDAVAGTLVIVLIFLISSRNRISHDNAVSDMDHVGEVVKIKKKKKKKKDRRQQPQPEPQPEVSE